MPQAIHVELSCPMQESFRVQQVVGMFGLETGSLPETVFDVELPDAKEDWSIGAIVGPSGSGKSTIAHAAFGEAVYRSRTWRDDVAVVDDIGGRSVKQAVKILTAVGFGSPPAWLRPYRTLSGGEQFRCDLARALLENPPLLAFDEFTSVVDRTVAQIASAALAKAVRKRDVCKKFVAVTCHYDVLPWLEPDWVLDMAQQRLDWRRLRRPQLRLRVSRCKQTMWRMFARHHYLSSSLPRSATCFVACRGGQPVAFCATAGMYGVKGRKRISRIVTLPDYQGLGIGVRLTERVADYEAARGFGVHLTASHPAIIGYCRNSKRWRTAHVAKCGHRGEQWFGKIKVKNSAGRSVVSFAYQGAAAPNAEHCGNSVC